MRPIRPVFSVSRSLAAPAVTAPLEVLDLILLVVLVDTVDNGAGVVCEPAPVPVDEAVEDVGVEPEV